uniref:NADH-ubiquinone oxidoreductase chain 3 n=1 Tax=Ernobius pini TaxID=1587284 RepID=A0A343C4R0_9COLE|nr:NADH dehydrogenase subunit 3 [Ernobius pini]
MLTTSLGLMIMIISTAMMTINTTISKKTHLDREKASPFECGFDPKSSPRLPFSSHFFLIAVIFLIFDVEITLLLPMVLTLKITNTASFFFLFSFFVLILILGTYHEWRQGALNWVK